MKPQFRFLTIGLMWGGVALYVAAAWIFARDRRSGQKVSSLSVEVTDSTSQGYLVTAAEVRGWISRSKIPTIGTAVDEVDLTGIEALIARNGFIRRVSAYTNYEGELKVKIAQRKPFMRLLTDGINAYVTSDGFVFPIPTPSSLYVPVVSGSYRPPFSAGYAGDVRQVIDEKIRAHEERIREIESEKYPFYERDAENDQNFAELRRRRIKRRWWAFESREKFEKRVEKLRHEKAVLRRNYRYEAFLIHMGIRRLSEEQENERRMQKKLEKNYEDFMKLITFVEMVEDDGFWRSEVVQIVARTTPSGALEVELVPRSGRHVVLFGRLERIEEKFSTLRRFYRKGLSKIGWDRYRTIDIRYRNQVICRR